MKWFELVFSDQPRLRYRRHVIFWVTWWIYFAGSYFFTQQGADQSGSAKWVSIVLIKSFLLLLCHAFMVYTSTYLLLPRILEKRRWFSFVSIMLTAVVITIAWGFFCYAFLFPQLDSLFQIKSIITKNNLFWNSIAAGLISSLKVVIAAAGIKLLKHWWQKQKENEKLEKEKIAVELQLLKAQIHPDVLFSSLDTIYEFAQNNPGKASELLLKLSDLLSYVLYECELAQVPLDKELKMIKDYMALQKTRRNDQLEVSISVKGNAEGKMIAPLLLLPFLENSLAYCNQQILEKAWINLDIKFEKDELFMKLVNGKSAEQRVAIAPFENGLSNVNKRLQLLYPGNNELRIHAEPEVMMTYLKIKLKTQTEFESTKTELTTQK